MDYASLVVPVDSVPAFDEYIEPICNQLSEKISRMQRKMQVQLKQHGIQVRKEVRTVWSDYSTEYKKLLEEDGRQSLEDSSPLESAPLMGDPHEDNSIQMTLSTNRGDSNYSEVFPGVSTAMMEEEVLWKINFSQGTKAKDTKLFFFGAILFRLTFGLNPQTKHYFFHICPAEKLESNIRIHCKYRVHDPNTENVLVTQVAEGNYLFRQGEQDWAGIDHFAGEEIRRYLDGFKRLSLSLVIASEVGPKGDMRGVRQYDGSSLFA